MKIQKFPTPEILAKHVAEYILETVRKKPDATLVFTSGDTPTRAYQMLAEMATAEDFKDCLIIGLDEWLGIGPENEGSCRYLVENNFIKPLKLPEHNFTFFDALLNNPEDECRRIDNLIFSRGGLDFIIVGIGLNGHIGLNEPGYDFENYCHVTELAPETIATGQKYFATQTPLTQGITIGLKHLLEAKTAVLMASGESKAAIIRRAITSEISPKIPATVFQLHPNAYIWLDEAAGSLI